MAQVIIPISCRFAAFQGIFCEGELCAFGFPRCKGCPKSEVRKAPELADPLQSAIWRGWISGLAGIKK